MIPRRCLLISSVALILFGTPVRAGVGDPQVRTDHPWYPGELACSTFERLFATQAELYQRVTGIKPASDHHKALAAWLWRNTHYAHGEEGVPDMCLAHEIKTELDLAAWLWRNTHYAHGEEGVPDLWGRGFTSGDLRNREYWTGLFAHGFGLCGTTHGQWVAEMEALLGHNRGRCVGVDGHNSFEVFLTGGVYGKGKWVLLDHDVSTVVFDDAGAGLLSIPEIRADWKRLTDRSFKPAKQHGWLVCGLHPDDGGPFRGYDVAEYLAGYAGPPPMVHLRRGETLRRYLNPGLENGKTFVYWGRNYNTAGIPGPERSHTWINQPEKMFGSGSGAGYRPGQARFGNAVYTYRPNFTGTDYHEAVVEETGKHVVFELRTPFVIAATPASRKPWGVYEPGCKNGLVLRGKASCAVAVSTDAGKTWQECGAFRHGLDLTDRVKGHQQYLLRLGTGAKNLQDSGLAITTVCQANPAVMPRLTDGGSKVHFAASGRAVVSAGPTLPHARTHVVEGQFGSPKVTLEITAPRGERVLAVHAAGHVLSSNPPSPRVKYRIDFSSDGGKTWQPMVKDWSITRRGNEPKDFWSQSLCWGTVELDRPIAGPVRVRFGNDGGKAYARSEAHLVCQPAGSDDTRVTFAWTDDRGERQNSHTVAGGSKTATWTVPTGKNVQTRWVEFAADAPARSR
jgi:hypothetical protein